MDLSFALNLALPEVILAVSVLVFLTYGALRGEKSAGSVSALCGAALIAAAFAAAFGGYGKVFQGAFISDGVSMFAKVFIYIAGAVAIVLGRGYFERANNSRFEYPILILLATLGMSMMVSAGDLISLYVGLELQSLSLYILASFNRDDPKGSEAGLKYFVLGALSSGLLLYGASLVYGFSGSMNFDAIAATIQTNDNVGLIFGLVFVISGLAFKVSAAPFHMWTPDVYEGAPTPVVAFFAGAPKFAALVLLARVLNDAFGDMQAQWSQVVLALAAMSFLVGALGGLMQKDIKRLLAYSSIANMGYALLAMATGTDQGMMSLLLFMVLYLVDTTGLFAVQLALSRKGVAFTKIEDLSGLSKVSMPLTITITILCLSVLGMPPFSGFWAKFFVFGAALDAGYWGFAVAGLVASVIGAFYYLRIIKLMWFDADKGAIDKPPFEAKWIAFGAAIFAFPVAAFALSGLYPLAENAIKSFGLN
jgi:NADH-quinone oxidoreductase subunit N